MDAGSHCDIELKHQLNELTPPRYTPLFLMASVSGGLYEYNSSGNHK